MGLLSSIFKRTEASSGASYREGVSDELVQQTRTRARNRLIGALVLVVAGVLALPMLFDSEPRPLPGSTRIEVAPSNQAAPAPAASRQAPSPVIEERAADAGTPVDRKASPSVAATSSPEMVAEPARKPVPETRSPTPETRSTQAAPAPAEASARKEPVAREAARPARTEPASDDRARALLEGRDRPKDAAASTSRFVVQVAAYADQASLNQARARLEKLGLKTYTQSVRTDAGTRIRLRVGPFNDRDDADRALGRIKGAGLPGSVQTL